jgi:membrane-bound inhibitor of C-type lysozyme
MKILNIGVTMNIQFKQYFLTVNLLALLSACSSTSPFGSAAKEQSTTPKNATTYVCDGNKQFYVRMLNNGSDAWLIYPDHEVNLTKATGSEGRYTSGVITLLINGAETTLNDGEKIAYTGCMAQVTKH